MVRRQTISFDNDVDDGIDQYRRHTPSGKPVPSFSRAVNDLLREALRNRGLIYEGHKAEG